MKTTARVLGAILTILILLDVVGSIGVTYPKVVPKEPLHRPVKVSLPEPDVLALPDGRKFHLGPYDGKMSWEKVFSESDFLVDIEQNARGDLTIYANQKGWVCGTPWAAAIQIPLIPQTVYKDRRQLVAIITSEDIKP